MVVSWLRLTLSVDFPENGLDIAYCLGACPFSKAKGGIIFRGVGSIVGVFEGIASENGEMSSFWYLIFYLTIIYFSIQISRVYVVFFLMGSSTPHPTGGHAKSWLVVPLPPRNNVIY